ncbi:MAG: hypothetical protein ACHQK8_06740 [Bacteroidia bacterium]
MKTLNHYLFILVLLFFSVENLNGQNSASPDTTNYKYGVGAGAGFTTGYGLSFRYTPSRCGVQFNFAPYHASGTNIYSVGLTFLYRLVETHSANLFLYQGNHFYYNSQPVNYIDPNNNMQQRRQTDQYFNNGLGIGIEFIIVKRIGFNIMMGYAAYDNFNEVNFTGETGLYFKF